MVQFWVLCAIPLVYMSALSLYHTICATVNLQCDLRLVIVIPQHPASISFLVFKGHAFLFKSTSLNLYQDLFSFFSARIFHMDSFSKKRDFSLHSLTQQTVILVSRELLVWGFLHKVLSCAAKCNLTYISKFRFFSKYSSTLFLHCECICVTKPDTEKENITTIQQIPSLSLPGYHFTMKKEAY